MNDFISAITRLLSPQLELSDDEIAALIEKPKQDGFGDYAFPCFQLARLLRKAPPKIAAELVEAMGEDPLIERAEATGPYINFFVNRQDLARRVLLDQPPRRAVDKTVVIDFSSPNVGKPLAVHHLRSTMIGNAVANLYRAIGWNVVGINYLGDWGTTFGQLMTAYTWHADEYAGRHITSQDMVKLYVEFHQRAEADPSLAERGRAWFKRLEEGDAEARRLWQHLVDEALIDFKDIYARLGVSFDVFSGESRYNQMMDDIYRTLEAKGLVVESEGAMVVDLEPYDLPPCLLRKSDGATTYALRDLAAAVDRYRQYAFDLSLYVVAQQQRLHFQQVFKVLELAGFDWASRCVHVDFGMLSFGGEKFATRKGNVIFLTEVLDKAVGMAAEIIEAKNPDLKDKAAVAEMVGTGAIVFDDFRQRRSKDIVFDWNEALNFDGETGPYLQYTYVRLGALLNKYDGDLSGTPDVSLLSEEEEARLIGQLADYPAALERAATEYEPNVLARYLLDLAAVFNNFYQKHRVVGDDAALSRARIALVQTMRDVLGEGLETLGLKCPEQM